MTNNEKRGLIKEFGDFEIIAEYTDNQNIFDFVKLKLEDNEIILFCLSSWEIEENLNTDNLIEK